jgi:hypothetical protein
LRRNRADVTRQRCAERDYARACPGRYAASVQAPAPGDDEHAAAAAQAIGVVTAALKGLACTTRT